MKFEIGDLVRYCEAGPRGARRGLVGEVVEPSKIGQEKGWVRVGFSARYDDYAAEELEPVCYWAVSVSYPTQWKGPFALWSEAQASLVDLILLRCEVQSESPLEYKCGQGVKHVQSNGANTGGVMLHLEPGGEFRIVVAGQNQPSLYDKSGRKYA